MQEQKAGPVEGVSERILRLICVYERNNLPAGRGELEFDLATASWLRQHEDSRVQRMAECFLESYLNKRT